MKYSKGFPDKDRDFRVWDESFWIRKLVYMFSGEEDTRHSKLYFKEIDGFRYAFYELHYPKVSLVAEHKLSYSNSIRRAIVSVNADKGGFIYGVMSDIPSENITTTVGGPFTIEDKSSWDNVWLSVCSASDWNPPEFPVRVIYTKEDFENDFI